MTQAKPFRKTQRRYGKMYRMKQKAKRFGHSLFTVYPDVLESWLQEAQKP